MASAMPYFTPAAPDGPRLRISLGVSQESMSHTTLYGIPPSLYTGKVRSYLIKNGVPYREVAPTTTHYLEDVLPKAGKRMSMPTIELPDGTVVRDGAAIVDHFEGQSDHRATPPTPRQRVLALLIDVIGMEGLMRAAMHYRWNFPDENLELLTFHFKTIAPHGTDPVEYGAMMMDRMRGASVAFGVVPETFDGVERRYEALLPLLSDHFEAYPYFFGGRPSLADYSMIAPFYGHLGRDPKPLSMMQARALHLYRWVERMHRPEPAIVDYMDGGELAFDDAFLAGDEIPDTLVAVLRQLAIDFVPETVAAADTINGWLDDQSDLEAGTPCERGVGMATFEVEGQAITAMAQPYRFYLLSRAQAAYDGLGPDDRKSVEQMLDACHLLPTLDARLSRAIGRENNLEVWAER